MSDGKQPFEVATLSLWGGYFKIPLEVRAVGSFSIQQKIY